MQKKEMREVEVEYCDGCGNEAKNFSMCAVCKRHFCLAGGGAKHSAFSVEIFRYEDRSRLGAPVSLVCRDCGGQKFDGTIKELFDGMMGEAPVAIKK